MVMKVELNIKIVIFITYNVEKRNQFSQFLQTFIFRQKVFVFISNKIDVNAWGLTAYSAYVLIFNKYANM